MAILSRDCETRGLRPERDRMSRSSSGLQNTRKPLALNIAVEMPQSNTQARSCKNAAE
jgi:hypothetical protein